VDIRNDFIAAHLRTNNRSATHGVDGHSVNSVRNPRYRPQKPQLASLFSIHHHPEHPQAIRQSQMIERHHFNRQKMNQWLKGFPGR
jgi:hypothetical protein